MALLSSLPRRESMVELYSALHAQTEDDAFGWLEGISEQFMAEGHDKPTQAASQLPPFVQSFGSPASNITSYASSSTSAGSSPEPNNLVVESVTSEDSSSDSDSDSDSDEGFLDVARTDSYTLPAGPIAETIDAPYVPTQTRKAETPSSAVPRPVIAAASYSSLFDEADADGDADEESDGNATDDEYVPSPRLNPLKRRYASCSPSSASSSRTSPSAPTKRPRPSPPSRNVQSTATSSPASPTPKSNPWACPHCPWVQRNRRTPDLKRHIRTHTRAAEPPEWVCTGVPYSHENLCTYKLVGRKAEPQINSFGVWMVGGCAKTFSRRDALKRHLDNNNIGCVGNLNG